MLEIEICSFDEANSENKNLSRWKTFQIVSINKDKKMILDFLDKNKIIIYLESKDLSGMYKNWIIVFEWLKKKFF